MQCVCENDTSCVQIACIFTAALMLGKISYTYASTNSMQVSGQTYIGALDWGKGAATKLGINVAAAQVVDNNDVVSLIGKMEGGRPATESITTQNDYLLLLGGAVGTNAIDVGTILNSLHNEGGALSRRSALGPWRYAGAGSYEGAR